MKAWWDLKHYLVQSLPSCKEEWLRQPLILNPLFTSEDEVMLGKRTRLNWADFDKGEAKSVGNWLTFSSSAMENKTQVCSAIWGGNIMYSEMDSLYKIFLSIFSNYSVLVGYVFIPTCLIGG